MFTGFDPSIASTATEPGDGDALTRSWTFGDGGSASGMTTSHTYPSAGSFVVMLTVGDGSDTDQATRTVVCSTKGPQLRCK